jgi:hypothetical protein
MTDLIEPFIKALGGDSGVLVQISAWMVTCRAVFKLFSEKLQQFMDTLVLWIMENEVEQGRQMLSDVFGNIWYRVFAFLVDYMVSIKLPTIASLKKELDSDPTDAVESRTSMD